ncbi:hypothetical protein [Aquamicrobium defluvii]|uniref:Uncharacterized protein n=1 Tax=Aquamicrobium defluvii TaxID=69279 RepID=A0A4R6Y4T2_9HYPH|nr:hypothetical protein [Aquamicrobium defluvii]TDR28877.1 hypothetical protein DES43_1561 [Aquamicrobium defluvii]
MSDKLALSVAGTNEAYLYQQGEAGAWWNSGASLGYLCLLAKLSEAASCPFNSIAAQ